MASVRFEAVVGLSVCSFYSCISALILFRCIVFTGLHALCGFQLEERLLDIFRNALVGQSVVQCLPEDQDVHIKTLSS